MSLISYDDSKKNINNNDLLIRNVVNLDYVHQ